MKQTLPGQTTLPWLASGLSTFADHPQIKLLESGYFGSQLSYAEWSHLWLNNPAYREVRSDCASNKPYGRPFRHSSM